MSLFLLWGYVMSQLAEDIDFEDNKFELEVDSVEPFDPTKIRVDTRPMPIDLILKRIQYEEIDLAPSFQRLANIWNQETQSKLGRVVN